MAVFRVERTRDYTVMCNHHLKDSNLSLKAKGLLSMMLSLPDEWNYTTRGLAAICKEGVDAIGKTLKELELAGYIIRRQLRGKDGRISDTEYTIFEKPRKPSPPDTTLPDTENPYLDNPDTEAPDTDNPAQLNTKKSNTQKSNTDLSSTHSFFLPAADGMTDGFEKKAEIREQIEYDILCQQYDRMQLDELVEIMLEVAINRSPTVKIGRDAEYPTGFVQQRFEKITSMHMYAADVIVTYQVLPERSAWLYANVSDTKNLVGDELVASAIKSAMAELGPNEVTNRTKIEPLAQQKLAESLNQKYGEGAVFINKVVINNMNFEEAYNTAIQQKSIAQQNADKQKIENEAAIAKAEADKQVAITNAEAEAQKTSIAADAQAEANRKIAESLSEPLIEYQKIQKWDGKLPTVSGSNALVSIDPAE